MKRAILTIFCMYVFGASSQSITLLYTGGNSGNYTDSLSWVQINVPSGQTPVHRVPTSIDDVVFSKAQSGLSYLYFTINSGDAFKIGGDSSSFCRRMYIRGMEVYFDYSTTQDYGATVIFILRMEDFYPWTQVLFFNMEL